MEDLTLNTGTNNAADDDNVKIVLNEASSFKGMFIPFFVAVYLILGITQLRSDDIKLNYFSGKTEAISSKNTGINFLALLAKDEFGSNLRDTIYTDKDKYLEMRIDEQMVYVHYRDGSVKEYAVSSGNKYLDKGVESRPGLFAIFMKEELHLSSQFNDAKMFYYMPYNMGIGFHGLAGTGYYGHLGVRPSSHGCIRMRTSDARELFKQCEVGTLVLSHRGNTARVVAFAPEGFANEREYTKEEYMNLMAYNLNSIYEGKYFINPPKRFIIDPTVIPKIGINIGSEDNIPQEQQVPINIVKIETAPDNVLTDISGTQLITAELHSELADYFEISNDEEGVSHSDIESNPVLVKKFVYNPVGILPYFPPNR